MKKTITLIAICITGNFHWVFAQMNFAADDGLHFSKPNCLIFGNQGNGGTELLYQPGPNESTIKWQTIKETTQPF